MQDSFVPEAKMTEKEKKKKEEIVMSMKKKKKDLRIVMGTKQSL